MGADRHLEDGLKRSTLELLARQVHVLLPDEANYGEHGDSTVLELRSWEEYITRRTKHVMAYADKRI